MSLSPETTPSSDPFMVNQDKAGNEPLRDCVVDALENYFSQLNGHDANGLYQMVMAEVEAPLLETVLKHTGSNQTQAAKILGMSRSTLRKKLTLYGLD